MRVIGLGHVLFALTGVGLAVLSFIYGDLTPMWQFYLPAGIPERETWVYATALLLLASGVGLCFPRTALPSALAFGAYYAVCAATRVTPIVSQPLEVGAWYGFCEAVTALTGAWILYALLRQQSGMRQTPAIAGERAVRVAQILFGLTCAFYGLSHFVYADYTASMVPGWLPAALRFAYLTGFGHAAAGVGIIFGILPRLAAILEAIMMSLFGLLVWLPSLFAQPTPKWATPPLNQWSEIVVNLMLAAAAWIVATSLRNRPWGFARARA
jgi:uncharacterized membrane protein YphA (DoxX/SURF4 family)